ncbi:MAG: hypothetical protein HZB55_19630 [Deltaproteobacteria bacterium]|nr:hypothetical protein [Deltaproteobacteria bacterium]
MTTNLLLDVNIVVDFCAERSPHFASVLQALDKAQEARVACWLYAGSVQTLEYVLANELRRVEAENGQRLNLRESHLKARALLESFCADKQWLAALSEDGAVLNAPDPEDAQFCRAVTRLGSGARILTRDETLLAQCSQAI